MVNIQVGIEGNTLTINELIYLLETGRAIADKSIAEHNEILGLELGMRYLKSLASVQVIEITDILEMHKRVMGHVDPLLAGVFRSEQVRMLIQSFYFHSNKFYF